MAICRPPNICPICGERIKEIHDLQEGIPFMMKNIGDNFIGYENHVCDPDKKKEWPMSEETKEAIDEWQKSFE